MLIRRLAGAVTGRRVVLEDLVEDRPPPLRSVEKASSSCHPECPEGVSPGKGRGRFRQGTL